MTEAFGSPRYYSLKMKFGKYRINKRFFQTKSRLRQSSRVENVLSISFRFVSIRSQSNSPIGSSLNCMAACIAALMETVMSNMCQSMGNHLPLPLPSGALAPSHAKRHSFIPFRISATSIRMLCIATVNHVVHFIKKIIISHFPPSLISFIIHNSIILCV